MKKTAKEQKIKWEQKINQVLETRQPPSMLTREHEVGAAANIDAVRAIIEHLYLTRLRAKLVDADAGGGGPQSLSNVSARIQAYKGAQNRSSQQC